VWFSWFGGESPRRDPDSIFSEAKLDTMQKFLEGFECPKKFKRFGVLFASGNSTNGMRADMPTYVLI